LLTNVKEKLHEPAVKELLSYAVYPEPEKLDQAVNEYETNGELQLLGLMEGDSLIAVAGFAFSDDKKLSIRHLAVEPEFRGQGYGRGLLLELIDQLRPVKLVAETDDEAADFYRNVGFTVWSLGELYPGVERFRCVYDAESEDSENND